MEENAPKKLLEIRVAISNLRKEVVKGKSLTIPSMLKYLSSLEGLLASSDEWRDATPETKPIIRRKVIITLNYFICFFCRSWNQAQLDLLKTAVSEDPIVASVASSEEVKGLLRFYKETVKRFERLLKNLKKSSDENQSVVETVGNNFKEWQEKKGIANLV